MTEDPGDGFGERVVTHSLRCDLHPEGETARITWWVYAGRGRIRKTAKMRGTWGHDATCSCGWDSNTGGATRGSVYRDVKLHKLVEHGVAW